MAKRWIPIAAVLLFLMAVFCSGFFFFYNRIQRSRAESKAETIEATAPEPPKSLINKPFPQAQLIDASGSKADDQILKRGKVVVVFVTMDCDACETESKFLQTVLDRRKDVAFYGIVPFGPRPESAEAAAQKFPFKVFYDQNDSFVFSMGINRVPVKVYLEDGIIKKGWIGAVQTDQGKTSFVNWLDSLQ
ncbi:MAG: redoxin family protein [Acidobacteria bacterium]|nr:redoxin family protein [Acidobacteriota bacterium]